MAAAKSNDNKAKYKAILGRLSDYFGWTLKTVIVIHVG